MLFSTLVNLYVYLQVATAFYIGNLPEYMTRAELAYYFNAEDSNALPDYDLIYLPADLSLKEAFGDDNFENNFDFTAFGRPVSLKLKKNLKLVSPTFKTYVQHESGTDELPYSKQNCHYLHADDKSVAAISICQPKRAQGLLFMDNSTLEIHPLTPRLYSVLKLREPLVSEYEAENKYPHIIRRALFTPQHTENTEHFLHTVPNVIDGNELDDLFEGNREAASHRPTPGLTAEVALFFDEKGYELFAPYFKHDDSKIRDMLLAYMNGIQALYHLPSIGTPLELVLVRLDIMKKQPSKMPHYDGERSKILDSFCAYQKSLNPIDDSNPAHWDMALYVSGLDFFHYENGRKSGVTMGLATVGGVCLPQYACVIAELGTTNMFGKPYPSAGFTSVYILAHEIGHNLGMHHDSSGNTCPKEGYIMSPSRGVTGETQWSHCSADVMAKLSRTKCLQDAADVSNPKLDHSKYLDTPGRTFTAKKQCEVLLRDKDAVVSPNQQLSGICNSIECRTPHRSGYYFAGPALEGTECGRGKYCYGGNCVSKVFPTPVPSKAGGWGPWKAEICNSGCLEKSKGFQIKRRLCNNPTPVNTDRGCEGSSYEVQICKDEKVCRRIKRRSAVDYASDKCNEFSKVLPQLDAEGGGLQAPHEEARVWMSCAIFCRQKESGAFYTPRVELNDLGLSPYFPEGTWCHKDGNGLNYFCRQNHCLPENFEFNSSLKHLIYENDGDLPIPQNAYPDGEFTSDLRPYFSLSPDGRPLQTILKPGQIVSPKEEGWETKDYIELPDENDNMV